MPHYKNRNNTSKKSNASQKSLSSTVSEEDDDFRVFKQVKTSKNSTPKNQAKVKPQEEKIPEPEVVLPEWEYMGISEEEYNSWRKQTDELIRLSQLENLRENMLHELDSLSYWKRRLDRFEKMREEYNKKGSWSATVLSSVDYIDECIEECIQNIEYLDDE